MAIPFLPKGAPVTYVRSGFDPTLNRLPPRAGSGCRRVFTWVIVGLIGLGGVVAFIGRALTPEAAAPEPTGIPTLAPTEIVNATATPTATLDSWSATGTALFFATASPRPPQRDGRLLLVPYAQPDAQRDARLHARRMASDRDGRLLPDQHADALP
ncbi:MAG: hypothetical protein IPK52_04280 [Chloroflexi bacterium]|nr:hypothetical protein [Chloroflexota bacterium]